MVINFVNIQCNSGEAEQQYKIRGVSGQIARSKQITCNLNPVQKILVVYARNATGGNTQHDEVITQIIVQNNNTLSTKH
jgi:hypothetical protein